MRSRKSTKAAKNGANDERRKKLMATKTLASALFGFMTLAISAQLFAQEDVIEKRKALMKANNEAISKSIKKAVEEKDYATIELKAKDIMGGLEKAESLFPKGSTSEKSRAHPDIWEKPDEFKKDLAKAIKSAGALSKAAAAKNEAEVNAKVKELGNPREGACGDCHKVFRKDFRKDS
jgi:cytochrome c556